MVQDKYSLTADVYLKNIFEWIEGILQDLLTRSALNFEKFLILSWL